MSVQPDGMQYQLIHPIPRPKRRFGKRGAPRS